MSQTEAGSARSAGAGLAKPAGSSWALPLVLCIALPWLNPFASGPSPATLPLLCSLASVGFLMLLLQKHWAPLPRLAAQLFLGAGVFLGFALIVGPVQYSLEYAALQVSVLAVAACVCMGLGMAKASDTSSLTDSSMAVHIQDGNLARLLAWGWLIAALSNAVIGMCQVGGVAHFFYPWMNSASDAEVLAMGNLRQRNQLASLCTIGIAALAFLLSQSKNDSSRPAHWAGVAGASMAGLLLLLASAASLSRVGLFQCVAVALVLGLWWRALAQPVRWLALWLVPVYALCSYALTYFGLVGLSAFARLNHEVGCSSRVVLYRNVGDLVWEQPWLGWGWRELAYAHYSADYSRAGDSGRFCDILDNAHNFPLHLAVEFGLPLATLWCAALVVGVYKAKPWAETNPLRQMAWLVLLVIGLHSLTEYPLWYGPFQIAAGLATGLLCLQANHRPQQKPTPWVKKKVVLLAWPLFAILVIALSAYLSWDYKRVSQIYLPPEERSAHYAHDTMAHVNQTWAFKQHARFAQLMLLPLDKENAPQVFRLAQQVVHFSPEPRVIERLIESATMLGHDQTALAHIEKYRRAYPQEFQRWQPSRQKNLSMPSR